MRVLKEVINEKNIYLIVNDWTHEYVETLSAKDALKKYGDCTYYGGYTEGFTSEGGFEITVWLDCWE